MSITNEYLESSRKVQQNWLSALDALTAQVTKQLERPVNTPVANVDPNGAIDELFDYWIRALEVQRDTMKKFATANADLAENWRVQTERLQGAVRDQVQSLNTVNREQTETMGAAAREQAQAYAQAVEEQVRTASDTAERLSAVGAKAAKESAAVTAEATDIAVEAAEKSAQTAVTTVEKTTDVAAETSEKAGEFAAEASSAAGDAAAEATVETADAAAAQAKRNYNLMNQAQLKAELASRNLGSEGTLDEMRKRLRENDEG